VPIVQALAELLPVADEAIPILVLPKRSVGPSPGVQSQRHDLFGVVQDRLDEQRVWRPDQGVPMVGHQNLTAEQKPQPSPRRLQYVNR